MAENEKVLLLVHYVYQFKNNYKPLTYTILFFNSRENQIGRTICNDATGSFLQSAVN